MDKFLICKANDLVQSVYIENPMLPVSENLIAHALYARVLPDDRDFRPYRYTITELAAVTGLERTRLGRSLEKINRKLVGSVITLRDSNNQTVTHVTVCASAKFYKEKGYVEYVLSPELKPYLLDLRSNYTSYRLKELSKLRSQYGQRLYDLLRQYLTETEEKTCWRQDDLKALRDYMGLQEKYPRFNSFRDRVLDPAIKEINSLTDIDCSFETIKAGRGGSVKAIKFTMQNKPRALEKNKQTDKSQVLENCRNQTLLLKIKAFLRNLSDEVAVQIADNADETLVEGLLLEVMQKQFQGEIKTTPEAYFMGALRKAVAEESRQSKKHKSTHEKLTDHRWMEGLNLADMDDWH